MKRAITYFLLSAMSAAAAPSAMAAYQVRFVDGGSLTVEEVERAGDLTVLTLAGGGTMGVRSSRISAIVRASASAAPAAEAPGPAPAAVISPDGTAPGADEGGLLMGRGETGGFSSLILKAAARHGVDAELLRCVLLVESSFDPRAVSPKGARGLAQLMPATARDLGVEDPFDAEESVDAAARLLSRLLEENHGRFVPALAAYNAGPGAVRRYGGVPPYGETIRYVEKILSLYHASSGD